MKMEGKDNAAAIRFKYGMMEALEGRKVDYKTTKMFDTGYQIGQEVVHAFEGNKDKIEGFLACIKLLSADAVKKQFYQKETITT